MSNLSQFGVAGIKVAQVVPLFGVSDNPTINGEEYLRSGVLKAAAGYSATIAAAPQLGWVVGTDKGVQQSNNHKVITYNGSGYYHTFGPSSGPQYSTDLQAWSFVTTDTDSTCNDAFAFGAYTIHLSTTASANAYMTAGVGTLFTTSATMRCGAVNAAGTLATIGANGVGAGQIYTATVGNSWTSRTPSGGANTNFVNCAWSTTASSFIYLGENGHAYTTANGSDLTDRGAVGSITALTWLSNASIYSAYSPTATLFSVQATVAGSTVYGLIRTTNGTSYTFTAWSSICPLITGTAQLTYNTSTGEFIVSAAPTKASDRQPFYRSTDDGLTWVRASVPMSPTGTYNASVKRIAWLNSAYVVLTDPLYGPTFTVPNLTETHLGIPMVSTFPTTNGTTVTNYVRIK